MNTTLEQIMDIQNEETKIDLTCNEHEQITQIQFPPTPTPSDEMQMSNQSVEYPFLNENHQVIKDLKEDILMLQFEYNTIDDENKELKNENLKLKHEIKVVYEVQRMQRIYNIYAQKKFRNLQSKLNNQKKKNIHKQPNAQFNDSTVKPISKVCQFLNIYHTHRKYIYKTHSKYQFIESLKDIARLLPEYLHLCACCQTYIKKDKQCLLICGHTQCLDCTSSYRRMHESIDDNLTKCFQCNTVQVVFIKKIFSC